MKKFLLSVIIIVFCFSSVYVSRSPLSFVSAAESNDFLETIEKITRYSVEPQELLFDSLNVGLKNLPTFSRQPNYTGLAVASDSLANDVKHQINGSFNVGTLYSMYGKMRVNYSGSYSGYYDIVSCAVTISDNINPVTEFPYPELPSRYNPVDFIPVNAESADTVSHIGCVYWTISRYDSNGLVSESSMAFVPDSMPRVVLFSNGDFGFRYRSTSGYLYNSSGKIRFSVNDNTISFKTIDTNSILYRSNVDSLYNVSDYVLTNYSLNTYYATMTFSNDSNYTNYIKNQLTINHNSISIPPVSNFGIPARTTINNNTINNYNEYGLDYNTNTNKISLDLGGLEFAFKNRILPEFENTWNDVYKNQPAPGVGFDTDIQYNYVDISAPPVSGSYLPDSWLEVYPAWEPEKYIVITTVPAFPVLPSINTDVAEVAKSYMGVSYELYHSFSDLFAVALFGLLLGFSVWIFKR